MKNFFTQVLIGCLFPIVTYSQSPQLIKDIFPGEQNSSPANFVEINNIIYFFAYDGTNGAELWRTDATEAGTYMVKNIGPGMDDYCMYSMGCGGEYIVMNNILYFRASDNTHGAELWRSDGTETGTYMVKDINPGTGNSSNSLYMDAAYFTVLDTILYFAADGGGDNIELWRSNGTESGTYMVKDFAPGGSSVPQLITNVNGTLYFRVKNATGQQQLWKSDGTDAGSVMLKQMWVRGYEYKNIFIAYKGYVYFTGDDNDSNNLELWRTDGTPEGTMLFKDLNPSNGSGPHEFHILNDKLFFTARPANKNNVFFVSDGTSEGTLPFTDSDGNLIMAEFFQLLENSMYFNGDNQNGEDGLWITDGTNAGTDFLSSTAPRYFSTIVSGNNILFEGEDDANGCYTLFQSNGTAAGTVQSLECSVLNSPSHMISYKGKVILNAKNEEYGIELWSYNPAFTTVINAFKPKNTLRISPNPATNSIIVEIGNFKPDQKISVINALGKEVLAAKAVSKMQSVAIDQLSPGLYFVKTGTEVHKLIVR